MNLLITYGWCSTSIGKYPCFGRSDLDHFKSLTVLSIRHSLQYQSSFFCSNDWYARFLSDSSQWLDYYLAISNFCSDLDIGLRNFFCFRSQIHRIVSRTDTSDDEKVRRSSSWRSNLKVIIRICWDIVKSPICGTSISEYCRIPTCIGKLDSLLGFWHSIYESTIFGLVPFVRYLFFRLRIDVLFTCVWVLHSRH